jgi:hypothetical protein
VDFGVGFVLHVLAVEGGEGAFVFAEGGVGEFGVGGDGAEVGEGFGFEADQSAGVGGVGVVSLGAEVAGAVVGAEVAGSAVWGFVRFGGLHKIALVNKF